MKNTLQTIILLIFLIILVSFNNTSKKFALAQIQPCCLWYCGFIILRVSPFFVCAPLLVLLFHQVFVFVSPILTWPWQNIEWELSIECVLNTVIHLQIITSCELFALPLLYITRTIQYFCWSLKSSLSSAVKDYYLELCRLYNSVDSTILFIFFC